MELNLKSYQATPEQFIAKLGEGNRLSGHLRGVNKSFADKFTINHLGVNSAVFTEKMGHHSPARLLLGALGWLKPTSNYNKMMIAEQIGNFFETPKVKGLLKTAHVSQVLRNLNLLEGKLLKNVAVEKQPQITKQFDRVRKVLKEFPATDSFNAERLTGQAKIFGAGAAVATVAIGIFALSR